MTRDRMSECQHDWSILETYRTTDDMVTCSICGASQLTREAVRP